MKAWLGRISLVFLLAFAAILELLLNRIGVHVATSAARAQSNLFPIVDNLGLFSFYFTGILALIVFCWGLVILIADSRIFGVGARIFLMLAGAAFLPLVGTGLFVPLPAKLAPYLNLSFALLVVALVVSFLTRRAALRHKLGVLYLAVPLLLHCYWLASKQLTGMAPVGPHADLPARLLEMGQHLVVVGAFGCYLFFAPLPRWPRLVAPIPLAAAGLVTGVATFLVLWRYPLAAKAAYWGLGVHLPTPTSAEAAHLALHLSSLFFFILAVVALFLRSPLERGMALGLLLIGVSGYHLELPYQFLLTLAGVIQLVRSILSQTEVESDAKVPAPKPARTSVDSAAWRIFLQRVAEDVGAEEVEPVVLQGETGKIARVRGLKGSLPLSIRALVQDDLITEIEVDVGQPPKDPPPASLYRRRMRRGHRVPDGNAPRVDFDPNFVLRDSVGGLADAAAPLIERLEDALHGGVSIWPGEGLRYLMRPLEDGWPIPLAEVAEDANEAPIEDLSEVVSLLIALGHWLDIR